MLRSVAAHLPDARIVLAGHRPDWVKGVEHIPVKQDRVDRSNVARILREVCAHPGTPPEWVLVNDDFFAMTPTPPTLLVHRGPLVDLRQVWRTGWYAHALAETLDVLEAWGVTAPLAYDCLHQPMPMATAMVGEVLEAVAGRTILHRSLYGNLVGGGVAGADVKVRAGERLPDAPWVSTAPSSWTRQAGRVVREAFPVPCRYEK